MYEPRTFVSNVDQYSVVSAEAEPMGDRAGKYPALWMRTSMPSFSGLAALRASKAAFIASVSRIEAAKVRTLV